MYNNKFKYDEKFTAEDKKVVFFFLGGGGGGGGGPAPPPPPRARPSTPLKIQVYVIASFFLSK